MRNLKAKTALLALAIAMPAMAHAQEADQAKPAADESADAAVDESDGAIVVTARKREESIRDVPGTINAVTTEQLEAKGPVTGGGDLLSTVPGVRFNGVAAENLSEVSVRGSGTQRATGADSGVGLFVNGAYVGSSTLGGRNFKTFDYFDIERVESLEGPQGALYGRNSEFGTINLVLAKPKFDSTGYVRGTYTFGLQQGRLAAVINEALSDTTAVRIGGEVYGQSKGFYYDPNKDKYYDSTKGWIARGQIRHSSGPLDLTLMIDAQDLDLPSFVNSFEVAPGTNAALPLGFTQNRFVVPHDGQDGLQQNATRGMLLASLDIGGGVTLESTSMYVKWRSQQQFAGAIDYNTLVTLRQQGQLGAYPFGQTTTDVNDKTFYQDLHLKGDAADGAISWIFGGEVLRQRDFYTRVAVTSPCAFTTVTQSICTGTPTAQVCLKPLTTSLACPAVFPLTFGTKTDTNQQVDSLAAYASLQYKVGDFAFTGEGRIAHDEKSIIETAYRLYTTTLSRNPSANVFKSTQPAWTLTASYKSPGASGALLYAKVGTGYRAGGVNIGTFVAAAPNPFQSTYDNEDTISYEAGVKANLASNIFARLSGYLSRTKNAITSISDGCAVTNACLQAAQIFNVNGGTIHANGLEASIDGRFHVGQGMLTVSLNASTQDAKFVAVPTGVTGLPVLGSEVAQIPDWTYSAVVDFRHPLGNNVNAFFNVNWSGQRGGAQDTTTAATPRIDLVNFDLFGARAGVNVNNIQLAVFVKNFTDEALRLLQFQTGGFPLSSRWNQPRTWGVTASYKW